MYSKSMVAGGLWFTREKLVVHVALGLGGSYISPLKCGMFAILRYHPNRCKGYGKI